MKNRPCQRLRFVNLRPGIPQRRQQHPAVQVRDVVVQGDLHLFSAVCLGLKILAVAVTASRAPVFAGLICAEHRNGKTVSNN